ncbi:MAG TPA: manganese efflux pump MntP family protein [Smithellaceae bacterium]|nr:manganese efflux pump MntP family protein [Smithellaceae bacterium]HRS82082.1 manganese efflux pump MntP family protein [Smithellaceae bacterium]HRV43769.1 manganese efflux pump MntP family protein [Smithellaceae bacterium]
MSLTTILLLAVGLGVDAFSVAIGIGSTHHKKSWPPVLRLSFAFGLFQFLMPLIGWLAGSTVVGLIQSFDHWVAFALLAVVGGKMIWEGFEAESDEEKEDRTRGWPLFLLSIATSIDALAVGFSFSLLRMPIVFPAAMIGLVCFLMTAAGMLFGKTLASLFGKKVEILGGLVLIGIGVKILIEHMG